MAGSEDEAGRHGAGTPAPANGQPAPATQDPAHAEFSRRTRRDLRTFHVPSRNRSEEKKDAGDKKNGDHEKDGDKKDGDKKDSGDKGKRSKLPLIIAVVVALLAVVGGVIYYLSIRDLESTDDAYTEGTAIATAAKVSGYVTQLNVNDNTFVHTGDLLVKIDPRDQIASRDQAKANLELALAQLASARTQLEITRVQAPASLATAEAQLAQARANQTNAARENQRQRAVDPRATTQNAIDQASTTLQSSQATVQQAQAQVQVSGLVQQNIRAAEQLVTQRQAQVDQATANLAAAETNLSYTELRAPQDGWITRRNVDLGTFVQAGQTVFYIVSPDIWVVANFKETQLAHMQPGQKTDIEVDAYPDLKLSGHVDSIQWGSGARFTTFPAENATGNFVKIVRRVPVKIVIDRGLDARHSIPLGLSVEPTVTVR